MAFPGRMSMTSHSANTHRQLLSFSGFLFRVELHCVVGMLKIEVFIIVGCSLSTAGSIVGPGNNVFDAPRI